MVNTLVVTNNPTVPCAGHDIYGRDLGVQEILQQVRDLVHLGHHLLTHPFAGSVKPNETPYKSVVVTVERIGVDYRSVQIIEGCLQTALRMLQEAPPKHYSDQVLADLALIDKSLLLSGLEALGKS